MPRNLKRYYGSGDLHCITCSYYHRQPLLGSACRRDLFLAVLEQVRERYVFVVLGYVVMPEHSHLLVSEPQRGNPSTIMQALKIGFARSVMGIVSRRGHPVLPVHIWQRRFYDFNLWTEHKRIEKLRSMHRNPAKRGLVAEPDQWRLSSFRFHAYGEEGAVKVNGWEVLKMKVRVERNNGVDALSGPHFSPKAREMGHPPWTMGYLFYSPYLLLRYFPTSFCSWP